MSVRAPPANPLRAPAPRARRRAVTEPRQPPGADAGSPTLGSPPLRVRPFRAEDREPVRRVCFETGYMGEPPWYWPHAASFADVFIGYYTDREPESLYVAELEGRVVGYLAGCVDSRRATPAGRAVLLAALRHGLPFRPGMAGFLARSLADLVLRRALVPEPFRDPRWPAHLHINLLPEARGLGGGRALMQAWLTRLRSLGSPGCHLGTLFENHRAIGFFERMGFRRLGPPIPIPGLRARDGTRHHEQILVRDLGEGPGGPDGPAGSDG